MRRIVGECEDLCACVRACVAGRLSERLRASLAWVSELVGEVNKWVRQCVSERMGE